MITHPEHIAGYAVVYINPVYQSVEAASDVAGEAIYDACEQSQTLKDGILEDYTADMSDVDICGYTYSPLRVLAAVDPTAYGELAEEAVQWLIDIAQCDWRDSDRTLTLCERDGSRWTLYALPAVIQDDDTRGLSSAILCELGYRYDYARSDCMPVWIHCSAGVDQ